MEKVKSKKLFVKYNDIIHIAGKMSILGGDSSTIKEHSYYLDELVRYNYDNEQESTD